MSRLIQIIDVTSDFSKSFRRLPQHIQKLVTKKDRIFRQDAFSPSLHTHKLKGPLGGYHAKLFKIEC